MEDRPTLRMTRPAPEGSAHRISDQERTPLSNEAMLARRAQLAERHAETVVLPGRSRRSLAPSSRRLVLLMTVVGVILGFAGGFYFPLRLLGVGRGADSMASDLKADVLSQK